MTNDFTRILVPTDFSAPSTAALALAKRLARQSGASIQLVHVLDDPFVNSSFAPEVYAPPPAGLRESWIKGAESLLSTQLTPEEVTEFRSTYAVLFGAPAKTVVDFATSHGVDLIVMGTHGRGGVAHLLMGSVAERVVRTAHCPVLTVRDETTTHRAEKPAFASTVV